MSQRNVCHSLDRKAPLAQTFAKSVALWGSVMCLSLTPAFGGAILYWDGDGMAPLGGAGTWNITSPNWSTTPEGSNYQLWSNDSVGGDDAVFTAAGGAVAAAVAGSPITVNSITFDATSQYTIGTSTIPFALSSPSGTLTIDVKTSTGIINAQYNVAITTIVKNGSGLLSSGVSQSAFAGKWIINGGTLSLPNDLRLGVLPTAVVPDQVTLNGGFLRSTTVGATFTANRGITLTDLGGGVDGTANGTITWNGPITGSAGGSFTKKGSVTNLVLGSNTSNYDGLTLVEQGRLTVGAANALGSSNSETRVSANAGVIFTGATANFTINEPFQIAGSGVDPDGGAIAVLSGANVTLGGPVTLSADATVTVSGDSTVIYNNVNAFASLANENLTLQGGAITTGGGGTIAGSVALGSGGLTKTGGGRWTLAGLNTYQGLTAVTEGALIVSGSIIGTFQVEATGTLGGGGSIIPASGGNINVFTGGKLAPGSGAGILSATLSGGGKFDINGAVTELNSQSLVFELGAPGSSDKVLLTGGALAIGTDLLEFDDFIFTTLAGFLTEADYVLFDGDTAIMGTLGTHLTGTVDGFAAELLFADNGKDIILHVVPEPSSAIALLGGAATLLGLRRRRS